MFSIIACNCDLVIYFPSAHQFKYYTLISNPFDPSNIFCQLIREISERTILIAFVSMDRQVKFQGLEYIDKLLELKKNHVKLLFSKSLRVVSSALSTRCPYLFT